MRVAEWHERWPRFARRTGARKPDTIRRTYERSSLFAEMFGRYELERVPEDALVTWVRRHPDKARYVRTVLNDAVAAGVADRSVLAGVGVPKPKVREHYLPSEGEVRLIADTMGELRKFTLLAAFTGLRVSEVCNLEAGDVLDSGRLRVRDGKGGRGRTVVVFCPEELREVPQAGRLFLREQVRMLGWLEQRELVPWTGKAVAQRWARARAACGLPENFRFHDLRRFHATWLLDRGASDLDVAVQLGHLDARGVPNAELVRRIYGRPSVDAALERLQALA